MILFVDDERREMDSYARELDLSGHKVEFETDVDSALKAFDEKLSQIKLLILDIMMPPSSSFKEVNTESGLRTGIHFYDRIREKAPELPVIILTNVSNEGVAQKFRGRKKCWFFRKEDFLPHQLAEEVGKILGQQPQNSFLSV
jgi:CheY-like chemotaxis protein